MDNYKIIKGVVSNGRYTVTAPIVKEDYGLYLQIEGVELPQTYEVDFSNSENSGSSVTMIGNADGVLIPSQFISSGKDVFAFLYHVGADFGRTIYKFRIPNKVRPDRTDDTPTPEQASVIDQAISALNTAVEQTAQDVASADQSAQSAQGYAEQAEQARDTAQTYANNAQTSANNASASASQASASATASAQSASQSAQIKADIEGMVEDAQGYADSASQSATASANSATQAQGYAQSASESSQSASGYASSAQTSANTASAKAQDASGYAQTATQKATESAQSATNASASATQAESAKTASQTAQELAESARDSAIQAKTDAESARDDAETARDEAQTIVDGISAKTTQIDANTENIASLTADKADVITDIASGAIASFPDGADGIPLKSLVVNINPVQDLHGQDAPYPAGGGKNLFSGEENALPYQAQGITITEEDGVYTIVANSASGYPFAKIGVLHGLKAGTYTLSCEKTGTLVTRNFSLRLANRTVSQAASYTNTFTLSEDVDDDLLVELAFTGADLPDGTYTVQKVQLELGSTATAYAPYENICPISGWTEVEVEQSGVNIANPSIFSIDRPSWHTGEHWLGLSDNGDGTYTATRPVGWGGTGYVYCGTFPKGTYSISADVKDLAGVTCGLVVQFKKTQSWDDARGAFYKTNITAVGRYGTTVTVTEPVDIWIVCSAFSDGNKNVVFGDIQIEVGNAMSDYEPYTGRSIPIDLGQTVYGGKLDVLSGVLTVDRVMVDLSTLNWYNSNTTTSGINRFGCSVESLDIKLPSANNVSANIICDRYATETADGTYLKRQGISINASNKRIFVFDPRYNEATDFKASFDHLYLCYELVEPIEIQLSPNQINSLLGVNNIWADSGDTEVEYRANTKLYIAKLTQPEEDDMIADSAITSGQFFMVGNSLYRALANIASGATITVGTNAQRVSLADALNLVNA